MKTYYCLVPRIINHNEIKVDENNRNFYYFINESDSKSNHPSIKYRNGNNDSYSQTRTLERSNSTTFSTINVSDTKPKKRNGSLKRAAKSKLRIINESKNLNQSLLSKSFKKPVFKVYQDPRFAQQGRFLPELIASNDSYGFQQPVFSTVNDKKVR